MSYSNSFLKTTITNRSIPIPIRSKDIDLSGLGIKIDGMKPDHSSYSDSKVMINLISFSISMTPPYEFFVKEFNIISKKNGVLSFQIVEIILQRERFCFL